MSSDVFSQSSKREKSSRNLHQRRQVSSILTTTQEISENLKNKDLTVRSRFVNPVLVSERSPHPPLHGHGTDVPPTAVQAAGRLLDGVVLRVAAAGVGIVEQDVAERQHRRHALRVLLDVPLQILRVQQNTMTFLCRLIGADITK